MIPPYDFQYVSWFFSGPIIGIQGPTGRTVRYSPSTTRLALSSILALCSKSYSLWRRQGSWASGASSRQTEPLSQRTYDRHRYGMKIAGSHLYVAVSRCTYHKAQRQKKAETRNRMTLFRAMPVRLPYTSCSFDTWKPQRTWAERRNTCRMQQRKQNSLG